MKKKFLLTLTMVLALAFVFAISVFATEITYTADFAQTPEIVEGMPTPTTISTTGRVVLKDLTTNTFKTYPTYYILKDQAGFATDYSNLIEKTGGNYTDSSIYMIEIPNGISVITDGYFGKNGGGGRKIDHVEKIVILSQDVVTIGSSWEQPFRDMPTCKSITFPKSFKTVKNEEWTFSNCTALIEVIFEEGSQAEVISFPGCTSLERINIETLTNLKKLGSRCFSGCTSLQFTDLDLTHTQLEEIGSSAFYGCTWLQALALPDTVTTFGYECFGSCTNMYFASDYLPTSLTSIKGRFLKNCKNINNTLIFPQGFTSFETGDGIFEGMTTKKDANGKNTFNLVFLGEMTSVKVSGGQIAGWANVTTFYFAQNLASDLNGRIVQGYTDTNGQKYYLCCDGDKNAIYTDKTTGKLTIEAANNNPNNETSYTPSTGSDGNRYNKINDGSPSFVFCGGDSVEQIFWARNGATTMGYNIFYTTPYSYDMNAHTTKDEHFCSRTQVQKQNCGYDGIFDVQCIVCDKLDRTVTPATGNHIYTVDSDCTTAHNCTVCEKLMIEALEHVLKDIIKYENGYMAAGTCTSTCTNEGCEHSAAPTEVAALFVNKGYTKDETENGSSLAYGISINKAAIEAYEKASGEVVTYGFIIGAVPDAPTGNLVSANGEILLAGAVSINLTEIDYSKYSIYNVKLTSITTDNQKALDIYFNAYAIVEGKVRYFGEEESETAVAISYNSIK